jgi:uncharacterized phage protein gp47/JayE
MSPTAINPASFIGRNRDEVAKRLIERLPKISPYTYTGEGSIVRAIMESVAMELGNAYALLSLGWTQQLVTEAGGTSLESLGALYGITRRQVSYDTQQAAFYFYLASTPNHQVGIPTYTNDTQFTIPMGTAVQISQDSVGDAYSMQTLSNVTFHAGDQVRYAALGGRSGSLVTNVAPHTLRVHGYTGTNYEYVYCTNPIELNTNQAAEPDEELRSRIVQAVRGIASANRIALRMAALSIDHVRDAVISERTYGPATATIVYLLDGGGTAGTVSAISAAVNQARAVGTYVTLVPATQYTFNISYGSVVDNTAISTAVSKSMEGAIKSYFNSLGIGQPFRRGVVLERMFQAAPLAKDVYITGITVNGQNFIGDTYIVPADGVAILGTLTQV